MRIKRAKEAAESIIQNPYHQIEFAKGKYRGKREHYAWRGDRLIFTVCEQCRNLGHTSFNGCLNCSDLTDDFVIFWEVIDGHRY